MSLSSSIFYLGHHNWTANTVVLVPPQMMLAIMRAGDFSYCRVSHSVMTFHKSPFTHPAQLNILVVLCNNC